jgi:hypothetical protein
LFRFLVSLIIKPVAPGTEGGSAANTTGLNGPLPSRVRFTVDVDGDSLTPDDLKSIHRELNELLETRLASSGISARITGTWNTYISTITNYAGVSIPPPSPSGYTTPAPLYLIDWENKYYKFELPVSDEGNASWVNEFFTPLVFPWCDSWGEVENKAIRILAGSDADSPILMYIFQNYRSSMIQYVFPTQLGRGDFPGAGLYQTVNDQPAHELWLEFEGAIDLGQVTVNAHVAYGPYGPVGGF